jgi:hypothetical protein
VSFTPLPLTSPTLQKERTQVLVGQYTVCAPEKSGHCGTRGKYVALAAN